MRQAMLKARADGALIKQIAEKYDLSMSTVHGVVKDFRQQLRTNPLPKIAEETPRAHLLKAFKAFWKNHSGAMIESSRMPALIKEFYKMCSLGTLSKK